MGRQWFFLTGLFRGFYLESKLWTCLSALRLQLWLSDCVTPVLSWTCWNLLWKVFWHNKAEINYRAERHWACVCISQCSTLLLQAWLVLLLENMFLGEKLPDIIFNLLAAQCAFIFGISFNSMKLDRSAGWVISQSGKDILLNHLKLRSSDKLFRKHDFFLKKIIVVPQEVETPPPLAQMVLTQCTSISELLVHHMAPPGGQI